MNGCTDTGNLIVYEVDPAASSMDVNYYKITIDSTANVIRFTGLTGGSNSGTFTLTVTGTLPDSVTQTTFTFNVIRSVCGTQVFTPSTGVNQVYYITDSLGSYTFPAFGKSQSGCSETYFNSISTNSWITGVTDNSGNGETVSWSSSDNNHVGVYTITITA